MAFLSLLQTSHVVIETGTSNNSIRSEDLHAEDLGLVAFLGWIVTADEFVELELKWRNIKIIFQNYKKYHHSCELRTGKSMPFRIVEYDLSQDGIKYIFFTVGYLWTIILLYTPPFEFSLISIYPNKSDD